VAVNFAQGTTVTGDNVSGSEPTIAPGQSAYGDTGAVGGVATHSSSRPASRLATPSRMPRATSARPRTRSAAPSRRSSARSPELVNGSGFLLAH
jgi:hypothetical protein